jgi:hypothetical protein
MWLFSRAPAEEAFFPMKNLIVLLVFLAVLSGGCAGVVSLRLPEEFKNKKLIEDPPASSCLPEEGHTILACLPQGNLNRP